MANGPNYFDSSNLGQVAGSLLARKQRLSTRDRNEALLLSLIGTAFNTAQNKQEEKLQDSFLDLTDKYEDIFTANKDIYSSQDNIKARADYKLYQSDKQRYLDTKAIELFNEDVNMREALGTNTPHSQIAGSRDLTPESIQRYKAIMDDKRKIAEEYIIAKSQNPAVTMESFTAYNQAAKDEYIAARNQLRDDPTKQSLLANAFDKLFGTGASKKVALEESFLEAQSIREAQDSLVSENDTIVGTILQKNRAILNAQSAAVNELGFEAFTTETQALQDKENIIINYFKNGGKVTEDKLNEAYSLGVELPAFPNLNELQKSDVEGFSKTFTKVEALKGRGVEDPTDFLTKKERDIYDMVYGTDRLNINMREEINSPVNRLNVLASVQNLIQANDDISTQLEFVSGDFSTDGTDDTSSLDSRKFISNIIRGSVIYQDIYDLDAVESIEKSLEDQLLGISIGTGSTYENPEYYAANKQKTARGFLEGSAEFFDQWSRLVTFQKQTNSVEFVNPDVLNLPLLPETADEFVQNINDNRWFQENPVGYIDESGQQQNFIPRKDKQFIEETEDYRIVFDTKQIGEGKNKRYVWYVSENEEF